MFTSAPVAGDEPEPTGRRFDRGGDLVDLDPDGSPLPDLIPVTPGGGGVPEAVQPLQLGNGGLPSASPGVVLAGMNSLTPARLLDTREGLGVAAPGAIGEQGSIDLVVTGRGGVPAGGVDAVALNVTVTNPTAGSFLTVWPTGDVRPVASSLNMVPGQTVANLVFAKVGAGGAVSIFNASGSTDVVADVVGWSGSSDFLKSLRPNRILDTRLGLGAPTGPVGAAGQIDLEVTNTPGVPASGVDSVVMNVTVTEPTEPSFVTVWPTGSRRPVASSLNMRPGDVNPNLVISKVGANGSVSLYNHAGTTHLVADVVGWLPKGGAYTAINPTRVLDTRLGFGTYGSVITSTNPAQWYPRQQELESRIRGQEVIQLQVSLPVDAPQGVTAVMLNLTATEPTQPTFVTAWDFLADFPIASSLNVTAGETRPNLVMARVGPGGFVNLYNHSGLVHLVADVVGYFEARNVTDTFDEVSGPQVHVVHVVPSDRSASFGEAEIRHVLDVGETFLEDAGGRGIRFDTRGGVTEISTLRIAETSNVLKQAHVNGDFLWHLLLWADGFAGEQKVYLVFVDGVDTGNLCGLGGGQLARVFTVACGGSFTGSQPRTTGGWEHLLAARTAVHELLHVLGAVSPCAGDGHGHVTDPEDIMSTTDQTDENGVLEPGTSNQVDPGNDDYWGQGNSTCDGQPWPDVKLSPFLHAAG